MKLVLGVFITLMVLSCKKNEPTVYLQQDEIQLVAPRIEVNSVLIDSFVNLKANLTLKGAEIYYTNDGAKPTEASLKYLAPIKVTEPGIYQFASFHSNFKSSESSSITFFKKGLSIDQIKWHTQPNPKYTGEGDLTVINQHKGSLNFGSGQWVGFDTIAKAVVSFKEKTQINTINIGYLNDPQSWIFPPKNVTVVIDGDEENKQMVDVERLKELTAAKLASLIIPIHKKVNSISIKIENLSSIPDWHDGKGQKAWLFMDEWIFN